MAAKYVTPAELAERWICSPDYIRKLIRMGGGWKIRWDEVYRYEKEQEKRDAELLRQQRIGYIV